MRTTVVLLIGVLGLLAASACGGGDKERIDGQNNAAATRAASGDDATEDATGEPSAEPTRRPAGDGLVSISVFDLRTGDCIADDRAESTLEGEVGDVLVAPCDHESVIGEVFDLVLVEDPPDEGSAYPGEDVMEGQSIEVCDNGAPYTFLYPLASSWSNGDRTIVCITDRTALYEIGGCVDDLDRAVSCENEYAERIVSALVDVTDEHADGAPYPDEAYFDGVSEDQCRSDDDYFLFPSDTSWERGDREIVCTRPLE